MISKLVNVVKISPYKGHRTDPIDTITIHSFVGQVTAESGTASFLNRPRGKEASANYVVGKDGSIGCAVDENDRSWCSSNYLNDSRAITIEVACDTFAPYAVTVSAYRALICLCADICRRYGKTSMVWIPDKNTALTRKAAPTEMRMTLHRWFSATTCPNEYLLNRMEDIAKEVNKMLKPVDDCHEWSKDARAWAIKKGIVKGYGNGQFGWSDPITREQLVTILYRLEGGK